jgi:CysZ protein
MTAIAPTGASLAPGFLGGVRCFWSGLVFLVKTPSAWPLAMVPTVVVVALTSFLGFLSVKFVPPFVAEQWAHFTSVDGTLDAALGVGLQVVATLLAIVLSFLIAFSLAQPLSGPALEALVRRQEADLGAPVRPETSFATDIARSLKSALVGFALGVPILGVLFVVGLVFPPAQVVTIPLKVLVVTTVLAWDLADYPLSVRGVGIRARMALLQRHFFAVLGMAGGVALLALIPCGVLLAIPIGVCGATRLIHEIEQAEGVRNT